MSTFIQNIVKRIEESKTEKTINEGYFPKSTNQKDGFLDYKGNPIKVNKTYVFRTDSNKIIKLIIVTKINDEEMQYKNIQTGEGFTVSISLFNAKFKGNLFGIE